MKKKGKKGKRNSVQGLLGIQRFTNYGLLTDQGELVFFRVAPTNISVLSSVNIESKITHLRNLLSVEPDIGIICTDSESTCISEGWKNPIPWSARCWSRTGKCWPVCRRRWPMPANSSL